jgi:putative ABC transport system substrate-binding protein
MIGILASSALLARPHGGWAQSAGSVRRIGWLSTSFQAATTTQQALKLLRELLRRAGYEEGSNLVFEVRFAEGAPERLPALADELVRSKVELIVAYTNDAVAAARGATHSIPIVMAFGIDPVAAGFVDSLARPGGNVTGTLWASAELLGKVLQVLKEAAPATKRVAVLWDPIRTTPTAAASYTDASNRAASGLGLSLESFAAARADDMAATLDRIAASAPDAVFVGIDPATFSKFGEIAAFAVQRKLVTIGIAPQFVNAGGLLCFGPDVPELLARTISYVDRILRGAKPAELPVEMPSRFELAVNLKTAKALAIKIPQSVLLRADRVIE